MLDLLTNQINFNISLCRCKRSLSWPRMCFCKPERAISSDTSAVRLQGRFLQKKCKQLSITRLLSVYLQRCSAPLRTAIVTTMICIPDILIYNTSCVINVRYKSHMFIWRNEIIKTRYLAAYLMYLFRMHQLCCQGGLTIIIICCILRSYIRMWVRCNYEIKLR